MTPLVVGCGRQERNLTPHRDDKLLRHALGLGAAIGHRDRPQPEVF